MIHFECESCKAMYRVDDSKAGVKSKCKKCGQPITVPQASTVAPPTKPKPPAPATKQQQTPSAGRPSPAAPRPKSRPAPNAGPKTYKSIDDFESKDAKVQALRGRPFDPKREASRRLGFLILLGGALLAGFILPVFGFARGGDFHIEFLSFTMLNQSPNWIATVGVLYPAIAGLVVLVVSAGVKGPIRGVILIVLGLTPVIFALLEADVSTIMDQLRFAPQGSVMVALLLLIGFYGVFIGNRARWYRPNQNIAYVFALIGGCCLLALMLVPFDGTPAAIGVFGAFRANFLAGIGVVIPVYMIIGCAVISVLNSYKTKPLNASFMAGIAFRLLIGSAVILAVISIVPELIRSGIDAMVLITVISATLKFGCWIVGIILLFPLGVIDMLVGDPELDFNNCVQCEYDLRATMDRLCPECGLQNPV